MNYTNATTTPPSLNADVIKRAIASMALLPKPIIAVTCSPRAYQQIRRLPREPERPGMLSNFYGPEIIPIDNQTVDCLVFRCRRTLRRYLKSKKVR